MARQPDADRRMFLKVAACTSGGLLLTGLAATGRALAIPQGPPASRPPEGAVEVSPAEDLMREHGVLERVLLVYDEALRRINAGIEWPPDLLTQAADLIRRFIEDYHERLEEQHLFPRFRAAHTLVDLVDVLLKQHAAGRRVTGEIQRLATGAALKDPAQRRQLADALRAFCDMYRPHAAREDTVLFPALRTVVSPNEYDALGEEFEDKEHALFGADGFENVVAEIAAIEKSLGIYELARFTPQA